MFLSSGYVNSAAAGRTTAVVTVRRPTHGASAAATLSTPTAIASPFDPQGPISASASKELTL